MFDRSLLESALKLAKANYQEDIYYFALRILSDYSVFNAIANQIVGYEEEKRKILISYYNGTNLRNLNELYNEFKNYKQFFKYLRDTNV